MLIAAVFMLIPAIAAASPITYTGSHSVGTGSVNLSLTTDGTIGVLTAVNFLDWTITVNDGNGPFTLFGPLSGNNSGVLISGTALTGTSTALIFDFSAVAGQFAFQFPNLGSGQSFYCAQVSSCFDFLGPGEGVLSSQPYTNFVRNNLSGQVTLATATAAVPEPATLSLLALGLTGVAIRLRRNRRVS
jgi:hypothetical protein